MSDDLRNDPLRIEEVLAGRRDPKDVDPDALAEARRLEAQFQQGVLPRTLDSVVNQADRMPSRTRMILGLASTAAAVAGVVLVALFWTPPVADPSNTEAPEIRDEYIGLRGGPTLDLRISREGQVTRWAPGMPLHPGDAVRLVPYRQGYDWLLVFAVDGAGRPQVVVPFEGAGSRRLEADGEPLPGSLVLDEVPGREALIAVFSREPLDRADAEALVGVSAEQRTEAGSRTLDGGAVVVIGIPYQKEAP
jgi:hypothetical protein